MKTINSNRIPAAILLAGSVLMLSLPCSAQAAVDSSPTDRDMTAIYKGLDEIEQRLYSHTYTNDLVDQRLQRLEKMAYGDVRNGSLRERLDAVIMQLDTAHASRQTDAQPNAVEIAMSEVKAGSNEHRSRTHSSPVAASTPVLQLEVPHSDTVKPVATFLRGGTQFTETDQAKLEALIPNNVWFKIPAWMAGTWHFTEKEITSTTDLRTGKSIPPHRIHNEFTTTWAFQQDKTGAYWEFEATPNYARFVGDAGVSHQIQQKNELVSSSDSRLMCRQFYTTTFVSNSNNSIAETTQAEVLATFTPAGSDQIKRAASSKIFDQEGTPRSLLTESMIGTKVAPYHPINFRNHRDLRVLFRNYLINNGHADLVPDSSM